MTPSDQPVRELVARDLGTSFVIEAGAGTGKTRLIIDRIASLVLAGRPLPRIVAITFTEKAASELKLRLRDRIWAMPRGELVSAALSSLEAAPISTIHAYCASLLRQAPVEAGIDPAFRVADEAEAETLRDEAWQRAFADLLETSPPAVDRALLYGLPPAAVEPVLRVLSRELERRAEPVAPAVERDAGHLPRAREILGTVLAAIERLAVPEDDTLVRDVRRIAGSIAALEGRQSHDRDRDLLELPRPWHKGSKERWRDRDELDRARQMLARAWDELDGARGEIAHDVARGWLSLGAAYREAYARRKREASVLDFDDLLWATRDLLAGSEPVRRRLASQIDALVVDEFQDTDPVQADIVRRLSWGDDGRPTPGRVFVVGDPKQSIYAFRGADVEAYLTFREAIREGGGRVESIRHTFRPVTPLLELANEVSARLFAAPGSPSYEPLSGGDEPAEPRPSVTVLAPAVQACREEEASGAARAEAWAAAALIREALDAGWRVRDRASGIRPLRAGDVAILLPAMTGPLDVYEEALSELQIPHVVAGGKRFYRSVEVTALQAATAAIDDPSNRLALVAALRSPLFGISDDALVRRSAGRHGLTMLDPGGDDEVAPALVLLGQLHRDRNAWSPARILSALLDQTGALGAFALKPDGLQRVQNLLKLVDEARRLADAGRLSFRRLARLFAERVEGEHAEAESPAAEAGEGAVEILTIHKSKGLEFGMVVLGGLAYVGRAEVPRAIVHEGVVEGVVRRNEIVLSTRGFAAAAEAEKHRREAEQRRLVYVALTRARDHLVLPLYRCGKNASGHLALLAEAAPGVAAILEGGSPGSIGSVAIDLRCTAPEVPDDSPRSRIAPERILAATPGSPASEARWGRAAVSARDPWHEEREALIRRAGTAVVHRAPSRLVEEESALRLGRAGSAGGAPLGLVVHRALEVADLADPDGAAQIAGRQARAAGLPPELEERAHALVVRALAFPVVQRARAAPRHWRELRFSLAIPAGILEGSVDLCFEEADGLVVVDYKTDQVMEKDVPARMKAHRTQLAVYALALRQITGRPVRALHALFLSAGIARELAVTESLLAHARAALERSGPAAQESLPLGTP